MARILTSASTSRTLQSVLEAPVGQPIVHFQDLGLTGRLLAAEAEEADRVPVQIDLNGKGDILNSETRDVLAPGEAWERGIGCNDYT